MTPAMMAQANAQARLGLNLPQAQVQQNLNQAQAQARANPSGARPTPMPDMNATPNPQRQPMQTVVRDYNWVKANEEEFDRLTPQEKKYILGNTLYPKIKDIVQDDALVPKVTGMLIDLEILQVHDIRMMIDSNDELKSRVSEAIEVMREQYPDMQNISKNNGNF